MHALPFPELSFDVVELDEVLARTDKPRAALAEAARVLRPAGRLLILDRILPAALRLPRQAARRALLRAGPALLPPRASTRAGRPSPTRHSRRR